MEKAFIRNYYYAKQPMIYLIVAWSGNRLLPKYTGLNNRFERHRKRITGICFNFGKPFKYTGIEVKTRFKFIKYLEVNT